MAAGNGLPCGGKGAGKRCKREGRRAFFDLSDGFPCAKSSCFLSRERLTDVVCMRGMPHGGVERGLFVSENLARGCGM